MFKLRCGEDILSPAVEFWGQTAMLVIYDSSLSLKWPRLRFFGIRSRCHSIKHVLLES